MTRQQAEAKTEELSSKLNNLKYIIRNILRIAYIFCRLPSLQILSLRFVKFEICIAVLPKGVFKIISMKYSSLFLVFLFILSGCKPEIETVEIKSEEGVVIEKYQRHSESFVRHGLYERFDSTGRPIETAFYQNDTLHGKRTMFFENGSTQYVENYENGEFEGEYFSYYENGKVKLTGKYTNSAMNGEWRAYYESGQLEEIVQFIDNLENGPFIEYHENGKLKAEGTYLEGDSEHGELKLYDEAGELFRTMDCNKGICRTKWRRDPPEEEAF